MPTLLAALLVSAGPTRAATVHQFNIVPVATAVNDFEGFPAFAASFASKQGIRVTQMGVPPLVGNIWLGSGLGNGSRSWFPDAGDDGWSRITLDSGENFDAVSFFGGSGWSTPPQTMYFELADDGVVVQTGSLPATFSGSWFGFAGGDFDEVRLRASQGPVNGLFDCPSGGLGGGCNFAWVDDIRVGPAAFVPTPATAWLVVLSLGLLAGVARVGRLRPNRLAAP